MNSSPITESLEGRLLLASFALLSKSGTLTVSGTSQDDTIIVRQIGSQVIASLNGQTMSFNPLKVRRVRIDGGAGNDVITTKILRPATLVGGDGDDQLYGSAVADTLQGGLGNNYLSSGGGGDELDFSEFSGSTFEKFEISMNAGDTSVDRRYPGGDPADEEDVFVWSKNLRMVFTPGDDFIDYFTDGRPLAIDGGAGNDVIDISASNSEDRSIAVQLVDGGDGDDFIDCVGGTNNIQGGDGNDTVIGGTGNDTIDGGDGNDSLNGAAGNDILLGGDGDDTINGGKGHDTIFGQGGNDQLRAQDGVSDTLDGGEGIDSASYDAGKDVITSIESTLS